MLNVVVVIKNAYSVWFVAGGNDNGGHAAGDRGHAAACAVQRVGRRHRVPGDSALAARVRRRARLQAGLHHLVPRGGFLRVDQGPRHAFRRHIGQYR